MFSSDAIKPNIEKNKKVQVLIQNNNSNLILFFPRTAYKACKTKPVYLKLDLNFSFCVRNGSGIKNIRLCRIRQFVI